MPGETLVIDECMIAWEGLEGKWSIKGMPHVTKIARKPKGVGAEVKSLADGESGVLLGLEIMEGRELMATKNRL